MQYTKDVARCGQGGSLKLDFPQQACELAFETTHTALAKAFSHFPDPARAGQHRSTTDDEVAADLC